MYLDFDGASGRLQEGFGNWRYDSPEITPGEDSIEYRAGGFYSAPDSREFIRTFYPYYNMYNTDHMGWLRWGYIDLQPGCRGGDSCAKFIYTGGAYEDGDGDEDTFASDGLEVRSKEQWESHRAAGRNPYASTPLEGQVSLQARSGSSTNVFDEAQGADRLALWVFLPPMTPSHDPPATIQWYPYIDDSRGSHFYHSVHNIGLGGWTRVIFDAHPHHKNSWQREDPYFRSCRVGGDETPGDATAYFNRLAAFSIRLKEYGLSTYPTPVYVDDVEFYNASQPENDETIAGLGIGFDPASGNFDTSFMDKYKYDTRRGLYEVRYSFQPITNANYASAKLCRAIQLPGVRTYTTSVPGQVRKPRSGYNQIWALLSLQDEDKPLLTMGNTVHFAVKDVSTWTDPLNQDPYDLETVPVPGVGDVRRIDLVKTLSYTIFPPPGEPVPEIPAQPRRLRVRIE